MFYTEIYDFLTENDDFTQDLDMVAEVLEEGARTRLAQTVAEAARVLRESTFVEQHWNHLVTEPSSHAAAGSSRETLEGGSAGGGDGGQVGEGEDDVARQQAHFASLMVAQQQYEHAVYQQQAAYYSHQQQMQPDQAQPPPYEMSPAQLEFQGHLHSPQQQLQQQQQQQQQLQQQQHPQQQQQQPHPGPPMVAAPPHYTSWDWLQTLWWFDVSFPHVAARYRSAWAQQRIPGKSDEP